MGPTPGKGHCRKRSRVGKGTSKAPTENLDLTRVAKISKVRQDYNRAIKG